MVFEVLVKDKNEKDDIPIAAATIKIDQCLENPNKWAMTGAVELVVTEEISLPKKSLSSDLSPSLALRIKYKPENEAYNQLEEESEDPESIIDYEKLEEMQEEYLEESISGRLKFVVNHAKGLVSYDGSAKTGLNPFCQIVLDGLSKGKQPPNSLRPTN